MGNVDEFVRMLKNYDKDHVQEKTIRELEAYTRQEIFTPDIVKAKSCAAASFC